MSNSNIINKRNNLRDKIRHERSITEEVVDFSKQLLLAEAKSN